MKIVIPERKASILKTSKGFIVTRPQKERVWNIPDTRAKRGEIQVFSRASALRMQKKLLMLPRIDGLFGVTLTIKRDAWDGDTEHIRKFWNLFLVNLKHACKRGEISQYLHFLWRIELQKNGTPHWHCLVSADSESDINAFKAVYHNQIKLFFGYSPIEGVAVNIRSIGSIDGAYAYISSHATKHKRSQLGWKGRQWGQSFISKASKDAYNKQVKDLQDNIKEIESEDDIPDGASSVVYSRLWKIEKKQYNVFHRILKRFIYSKLRGQKRYKGGKWVWVLEDSRKTCYKSVKFVDLETMELQTKFVKTSIKWFACRQAVQACHFVKPETARKLLKVAL